jgi:VWFA-related protein
MPRLKFASSQRLTLELLLVVVVALAGAPRMRAEGQAASGGQQNQQPAAQLQRPAGQAQQPAAQPQPPDQTTPDSGGPSGDTGVIAVPKKKENPDEAPPPPAPAEPKVTNPEGMGNVTLHVNVPEVTVDVGVMLEKTHSFVPGLKPSNFRVYEDGVQQKVEGFKRTEAPITALILMEYSARGMGFRIQALNAALAFAQQLRPQDYIAMMTFDLNSHIILDFTQDKQQLQQGMMMLENEVYMPAAFSESDVFDALNESIDRLERVEGQKYIILIATGIDTFSKLTFDKISARVKAAHDITIDTISTDGFFEAMTEGRGGMMGGMRDMSFLQADNEMKSFSDWTGGMHFAPRFVGEMPDDVRAINENIRAKYELVYRPTNAKLDGTFRKIRVELVDDEGQPLRMQDEKKKPLKYDIITRDGYRAKQEVE